MANPQYRKIRIVLAPRHSVCYLGPSSSVRDQTHMINFLFDIGIYLSQAKQRAKYAQADLRVKIVRNCIIKTAYSLRSTLILSQEKYEQRYSFFKKIQNAIGLTEKILKEDTLIKGFFI